MSNANTTTQFNFDYDDNYEPGMQQLDFSNNKSPKPDPPKLKSSGNSLSDSNNPDADLDSNNPAADSDTSSNDLMPDLVSVSEDEATLSNESASTKPFSDTASDANEENLNDSNDYINCVKKLGADNFLNLANNELSRMRLEKLFRLAAQDLLDHPNTINEFSCANLICCVFRQPIIWYGSIMLPMNHQDSKLDNTKIAQIYGKNWSLSTRSSASFSAKSDTTVLIYKLTSDDTYDLKYHDDLLKRNKLPSDDVVDKLEYTSFDDVQNRVKNAATIVAKRSKADIAQSKSNAPDAKAKTPRVSNIAPANSDTVKHKLHANYKNKIQQQLQKMGYGVDARDIHLQYVGCDDKDVLFQVKLVDTRVANDATKNSANDASTNVPVVSDTSAFTVFSDIANSLKSRNAAKNIATCETCETCDTSANTLAENCATRDTSDMGINNLRDLCSNLFKRSGISANVDDEYHVTEATLQMYKQHIQYLETQLQESENEIQYLNNALQLYNRTVTNYQAQLRASNAKIQSMQNEQLITMHDWCRPEYVPIMQTYAPMRIKSISHMFR